MFNGRLFSLLLDWRRSGDVLPKRSAYAYLDRYERIRLCVHGRHVYPYMECVLRDSGWNRRLGVTDDGSGDMRTILPELVLRFLLEASYKHFRPFLLLE